MTGGWKRRGRPPKGAVERDPRAKWSASDYDMLRETVSEGGENPDWPSIADTIGQTMESCKRIARMLSIFPELARDIGIRAVAGSVAVEAKELARDRDSRHVRACLAAGGFCRAEIVNGARVLIYPQVAA